MSTKIWKLIDTCFINFPGIPLVLCALFFLLTASCGKIDNQSVPAATPVVASTPTPKPCQKFSCEYAFSGCVCIDEK